jgi:type II secretory ATPase GspE/PulE/Tfp pilus assembly ATPase PilB-like protein
MGAGCEFCFGSGFVERIAIYEMLEVDDAVKDQIMDRANATMIKKSAIERGKLRTLRMDGIQKVLRAVTTIDEVLRVTQVD